MRKHLSFSFFLLTLLFLLHQLIQKGLELNLPFIDSYFDPFCFIALSLPLVQLERQILFKQEKLSKVEAFLVFLILALISEFLLPLLSVQFVYDPLDFLAMSLGYVWFIFFDHRAVTQLKSSTF
jgi:hypothetical protein